MILKKEINVSNLRIFKDDKITSEGDEIVVNYENGVYKIISGANKYDSDKKKKRLLINVHTPIKKVLNHLIYRIQKEKLNPIETALIFEEISQITGKNQNELSRFLDKTQGNISNKMRLLGLPNFIQIQIINENLTERHGRALLKIIGTENDSETLKTIYKEIEQKKLKVSETEILVNKFLGIETKVKKVNKKIEGNNHRQSIKNKTAMLAINQINRDLQTSLDIINRYYPELKIEKNEELIDRDYILKVKITDVR